MMYQILLVFGRAGFWIVHGPYAIYLLTYNWYLRRQLRKME